MTMISQSFELLIIRWWLSSDINDYNHENGIEWYKWLQLVLFGYPISKQNSIYDKKYSHFWKNKWICIF